MVKQVIVLLFLLALTSHVYGVGNVKDVTHYQYVTEWTPTYCMSSICLSGLPDIFVMHGIWPADSRGEPVDFCKNCSLSKDLMKRFQETLTRLWPSILKGMPPPFFWGHQYSKHGVCLEGWTGLQFISFATLVSGNNNMTKILESRGIVKSKVNKYSKNEIRAAVQTRIGNGFNIYLNCKRLTPSLFYLREVTVCIKKIKDPALLNTYEFQSCPEPLATNRNDCGGNNPDQKDIMLPSTA